MVVETNFYSKFNYINYINSMVENNNIDGIDTYFKNLEKWGAKDLEIIKLETILFFIKNDMIEQARKYFYLFGFENENYEKEDKEQELKECIVKKLKRKNK